MVPVHLSHITFCLVLYVGIGFWVILRANTYLFPAQPPSYQPHPPYFHLVYAPGKTMCAIYMRPKSPRITLLLSHGRHEDLGQIGWFLRECYAHQIAVMAYDYPGYGHTEGLPTPHTCTQTIQAAYRWLTEHEEIAPHHIFAYGYDVGSWPTLALAAQTPKLGGVILDGAWASMLWQRTYVPWWPWDRLNNRKQMRHVDQPTLIIHGQQDREVRKHHAKLLWTASASAHKHLVLLAKAQHKDRVHFGGKHYWQSVLAFIDTYHLPDQQPHRPLLAENGVSQEA